MLLRLADDHGPFAQAETEDVLDTDLRFVYQHDAVCPTRRWWRVAPTCTCPIRVPKFITDEAGEPMFRLMTDPPMVVGDAFTFTYAVSR